LRCRRSRHAEFPRCRAHLHARPRYHLAEGFQGFRILRIVILARSYLLSNVCCRLSSIGLFQGLHAKICVRVSFRLRDVEFPPSAGPHQPLADLNGGDMSVFEFVPLRLFERLLPFLGGLYKRLCVPSQKHFQRIEPPLACVVHVLIEKRLPCGTPSVSDK